MTTFLLSIDRQHSVLGRGRHEARAFSPYGALSTALLPGLAFCGQHPDPLTGCYPLGNGRRFYSPSLRRFISSDSLSPFGKGGIHAYAYCGGDPVNRHDPSGAFWGVVLRIVGVASSGATLFGSLARTAKNVVGRRAAFRANNNPAGGGGPVPSVHHQELPHASRVSNQQFFITGSAGVAGQLAAAISGVTPAFQTATDVLGVVNSVTNLSGGSIGNFAAAREVGSYLWANPREIPVVALETLMDVTMVDEVFANVGRGFTAVAERIRSARPTPHDVPV
ncbi:RHS repeat-associated core domain-containing protein [Pseudomonas putida]|uniref:RHS repeat-associated core domain-containing protein n=1 Tax=Pseudomonas putida TaxID=303 RepID=UPI003839D519